MIFRHCLCYLTLIIGLMSMPLSAIWQQPPNPFSSNGFGTITISSGVATNNSGLAAVLISSDSNVDAYNYSNGTWTVAPSASFPATDLIFELDLDMDPAGTAIGAWADNSSVGNTVFYNGTFWITPGFNPMAGFVVDSVAVAMNGPGQGVLVFNDDVGNIRASFFSAGTWSPSVIIGTGGFDIDVAYSVNGTAVAGWQDGSFTNVSNFIGGVWQPQVLLDPAGDLSNVGIDATGKALALWESASGDVLASTFNGSTWLAPQTIAAGPGNFNSALSMSSDGSAVAVYLNSLSNGFSSYYNGTSWSSPIQFTSDIVAFGPSVSVNSHGNALVVWGNSTAVLKSSVLLKGISAWNPEEIIQVIPPRPAYEAIGASLSDNGVGFAAWLSRISTTEGKFPFASAMIQPLPPTDVAVNTCSVGFASGGRTVTVITFDPSTDPSVIGYFVFRNGVLIATLPATEPPVFFDYNRCRNDAAIYTIVSVDINQTESIFTTISVN